MNLSKIQLIRTDNLIASFNRISGNLSDECWSIRYGTIWLANIHKVFATKDSLSGEMIPVKPKYQVYFHKNILSCSNYKYSRQSDILDYYKFENPESALEFVIKKTIEIENSTFKLPSDPSFCLTYSKPPPEHLLKHEKITCYVPNFGSVTSEPNRANYETVKTKWSRHAYRSNKPIKGHMFANYRYRLIYEPDNDGSYQDGHKFEYVESFSEGLALIENEFRGLVQAYFNV